MNAEDAVVQQMESHRLEAVEFAERFQAYNRTNSDWSYVPPKSETKDFPIYLWV